MIYKKHPEFNLIEQVLFRLLDKLNTSHPKKLKIFSEEVLSKYNDPIKYYESLIKFIK